MPRPTRYCLAAALAALTAAAASAGPADKIINEARKKLLVPNPIKPDGGVADRPKTRQGLVFRYGAAVVPAFLDLARHKDPNVRMNAVLGIGDVLKQGGVPAETKSKVAQQAQPVVLERMDDSSFSVRYAAMDVGGLVYKYLPPPKSPDILNRLLGMMLSRRSNLEKAGAARGLSRVMPLKAVEVTDPDPKRAASVVEQVKKWYLAHREAMGLIALRPRTELEEDLRASKAKVRLEAIAEIKARGDESLIEPLLNLLAKEKDAKVCEAAADAVKAVTGVPIRMDAAFPAGQRKKIIARWKAWRAAQPALKMLETGAPAQRDAAARALAALKDRVLQRRVVRVLARHILGEKDVKTTETILKALKELTGHPVAGFKNSMTPEERRVRIERWRLWIQAEPKVKEAFAEKDPEKRAALIRQLAQFKHAKVVDALAARVKKEKDEVVIHAITDTISNLVPLALAVVPGMTPEQVDSAVKDFQAQWKTMRRNYE